MRAFTSHHHRTSSAPQHFESMAKLDFYLPDHHQQQQQQQQQHHLHVVVDSPSPPHQQYNDDSSMLNGTGEHIGQQYSDVLSPTLPQPLQHSYSHNDLGHQQQQQQQQQYHSYYDSPYLHHHAATPTSASSVRMPNQRRNITTTTYSNAAVQRPQVSKGIRSLMEMDLRLPPQHNLMMNSPLYLQRHANFETRAANSSGYNSSENEMTQQQQQQQIRGSTAQMPVNTARLLAQATATLSNAANNSTCGAYGSDNESTTSITSATSFANRYKNRHSTSSTTGSVTSPSTTTHHGGVVLSRKQKWTVGFYLSMTVAVLLMIAATAYYAIFHADGPVRRKV